MTYLHRLGKVRNLHFRLLGSGFGIVGIAMSLANLIGQRHALVALSRADTGAHVLIFNAQSLGLLLGGGRLGLGSFNGGGVTGNFLLLGHNGGLALNYKCIGGLEVLLGAGHGLLAVLPSRGGLDEGLGLLLLGSLGGLVLLLNDATELGGGCLDLLLLGGDLLSAFVDGCLVLDHLLLEGIYFAGAGGNDLLGIGIVAGNDEALDALNVGVVLGPLEVVLLLTPQSLEGGSNLLGEDGIELVDLGLLLLDGLDGGDALGLVHARTGSLLDHAQNFVGLHVEDLGNAALHNEEVRVVHVELDGMEEIGHLSGGGIPAVDEVLAPSAEEDLAGDGHLGTLLVSDGAGGLVFVVEDDGNAGLVDAGLALLVDELREIAGTDLGQIGNAKDEADGVENVGLARSVQTSNGVEVRVESNEGEEGFEKG